MSDVFTDLDIGNSNTFEPSEFRVGSWDQYCKYISNHTRESFRPPKSILSYREDNPIGMDIED